MSYVVEQERESTSARAAEDKAFFDNLLGGRALFFFDEAAPILRVSVPTLYRRAEDGRLEYVRVGRRRAITNSNMRVYARNGI
jgi:excisionase family DNA binding protein